MTEKKRDLTRREFVKQAGLGAAALALTSTASLGFSMASTIKNGMGYRTLGRTGLEISEIALGGGSLGPTGPNLIRAALSQGINIIETSSNYRRAAAETAIGETVKSMGVRDKVYILTKTGNLDGAAISRMIDGPAAELEKAVREELEGSLQRLKTDYVDLFMCPYAASGSKEVRSQALQEILEKFKKEGKIRFTGLSTHFDYANVCMEAIDGGYFDVIMLPVNFATLDPNVREAVLASKKAGSGTAGKAGKDAGKAGKARKAGKKGGGKRGGKGRGRPVLDVSDVLKAAQEKGVGIVSIKGAQEGFLPPSLHDKIKGDFAKDTKLSFHQFAYRYVLDQPQVSAVAVRMGSMLHLNEALVLPQKTLKG